MKRAILSLVFTALFLSIAGILLAQEDVQKIPVCVHCGMDRAKFAHSRMYVSYDDGTTVGTCSIHCLAIDLAVNIDKTPLSIQVGDFNSGDLIDAEMAFWVIDDKKPGVMTKQAKWAFGQRDAAEKFISSNGGLLVNFDDAMNATYDSMYTDIKMIREKRKMMKMKTKEMDQQ
jgi:copper chaperone NosL